MSKRTSKSNNLGMWIFLGIMTFAANPIIFTLIVIGILVYKYYKKNPDKLKKDKTINNDYVRQKDKAHNYEVIDTSAEVISTKIMQDDEWKATKEYR